MLTIKSLPSLAVVIEDNEIIRVTLFQLFHFQFLHLNLSLELLLLETARSIVDEVDFTFILSYYHSSLLMLLTAHILISYSSLVHYWSDPIYLFRLGVLSILGSL